MKVLELFAGSQSFSKVAREMGHETFTTDLEKWDDGIDYAVDIFNFDISKVPFTPDIIWASPPCTYFSVASIGTHWHPDHTPKTKEAEFGMSLVKHTMTVIKIYLDLSPTMLWYIENPRGKLRKLNLIDGIRNTVTYCQYGDSRMKPTDIWTNNPNWIPRPMCKNGDPCHVRAPRGAKTGTQGLKGRYERSVVPHELCREILDASTGEKRASRLIQEELF